MLEVFVRSRLRLWLLRFADLERTVGVCCDWTTEYPFDRHLLSEFDAQP